MMSVSIAIVSVLVTSLVLCKAELQDNVIYDDIDHLALRFKKSPASFSNFKYPEESDSIKSEYKLQKTFKENDPSINDDGLEDLPSVKNNANNEQLNFRTLINKKLDELPKDEYNEEILRTDRDYYVNSDHFQPGSWRNYYYGINPYFEEMPMYKTAFGAAGIQEIRNENSSTIPADPSKQQQQQQQQQQTQATFSPLNPIAPDLLVDESFKHKGLSHGHPIKFAHPIKLIHADKIKPVVLQDHKKYELELALLVKNTAEAIEVLKKKKLIIDAEIKSKLAAAAAAALVILHKKKGIGAGHGHALGHNKHIKPVGVDVPSVYSYGKDPAYEVPTIYSYPDQANYYYPYSTYTINPQDYATQPNNGLYFDRMGYLPPSYVTYPEGSYVEQSEYYPLTSYIYPQNAQYYQI